MPVTIAPLEIEIEPSKNHGGPGGDRGGDGWGGHEGWGGSHSQDFQTPSQAYRLGMLLGLASILMLFVALSSAYVMRQGEPQGWQPIAMPPLLLPNTLALLLSSFTLELARRALKQQRVGPCRRWLMLSTLLGVIFLSGQLVIWRTLVTQGIYLGSNPHSSFFYVLTGTHGVHLLGGMVALGAVTLRARQPNRKIGASQTALDVTALYWHFMDGLWIYLFLLLFVWR
jgi:cytochrome c oxidase subunit III